MSLPLAPLLLWPLWPVGRAGQQSFLCAQVTSWQLFMGPQPMAAGPGGQGGGLSLSGVSPLSRRSGENTPGRQGPLGHFTVCSGRGDIEEPCSTASAFLPGDRASSTHVSPLKRPPQKGGNPALPSGTLVRAQWAVREPACVSSCFCLPAAPCPGASVEEACRRPDATAG